MLNYKHHQKSDDGSAGIDDELPGIAKTKQRTRYQPYDNDHCSNYKCERRSGAMGNFPGNFFKQHACACLLFFESHKMLFVKVKFCKGIVAQRMGDQIYLKKSQAKNGLTPIDLKNP